MGGKKKRKGTPSPFTRTHTRSTRRGKKKERNTLPTYSIQTKRRKLAAGSSRLLTTELHTLNIGLTDSHSILTPRNSIRMPPLDHSGLLKTQSTREEKAFIFRLQRFIKLFSGIISLAIKRGAEAKSNLDAASRKPDLVLLLPFLFTTSTSSRLPAYLIILRRLSLIRCQLRAFRTTGPLIFINGDTPSKES